MTTKNYIEYNGLKFYLDKKGYYLGSVNKKPKRLHVYVWETNYGPIPEGYHVHHKDLDKNNNNIENLILLSKFEHTSYHGSLGADKAAENVQKYARPAADKWHGSEDGLIWHKEQFEKTLAPKFKEMITMTCEVCGKEYQTSVLMRHKSKFCSNSCKSQYRRNSGADNIKKTCQICGKEFMSNKYTKVKTCSPECRRISTKLNREKQNIII